MSQVSSILEYSFKMMRENSRSLKTKNLEKYLRAKESMKDCRPNVFGSKAEKRSKESYV